MRSPPTSIRRTVVTDEYRNTSLIRTLRERWSLGEPLTARDAVAADIAPVLTRETPRAAGGLARGHGETGAGEGRHPVPAGPAASAARQYFLSAALEIEKARTGTAPAIDPKTATAKEAIECVLDMQAEQFPTSPQAGRNTR